VAFDSQLFLLLNLVATSLCRTHFALYLTPEKGNVVDCDLVDEVNKSAPLFPTIFPVLGNSQQRLHKVAEILGCFVFSSDSVNTSINPEKRYILVCPNIYYCFLFSCEKKQDYLLFPCDEYHPFATGVKYKYLSCRSYSSNSLEPL
jgi:hypothetical protein